MITSGRPQQAKAMNPLISDEELALDLQQLQVESIGWIPLEEGAYLHVGKENSEELIIDVVGIADAGMAGLNVLLLC